MRDAPNKELTENTNNIIKLAPLPSNREGKQPQISLGDKPLPV
jgi:hypothetical protein